MDFDLLGIIALLLALELVLGIDNVLVIAILVARLPAELRERVRRIGLAFAFLARLAMLSVVLALASLEHPLLGPLSLRDLVLLAGGLFLLWKAVTEIHHVVELKDARPRGPDTVASTARTAIAQIVLLDIVFSVDSVITAVGLTDVPWVIVVAVTLSFLAVLAYAGPVGEFILRHPSVKILALSFLVTIGVTITMEGLHQDVPRTYIYLPMGFALAVEMLQLRRDHNMRLRGRTGEGEIEA